MNTMRSTWSGAVASVILVAGGLLMTYGTEASLTGAQAASASQLPMVISKLNWIITDIGSIEVSLSVFPAWCVRGGVNTEHY